MDVLKTIKLPKQLKNANGANMKFEVVDGYNFEMAFKTKNSLLDEMTLVNEHIVEEADYNIPRIN